MHPDLIDLLDVIFTGYDSDAFKRISWFHTFFKFITYTITDPGHTAHSELFQFACLRRSFCTKLLGISKVLFD